MGQGLACLRHLGDTSVLGAGGRAAMNDMTKIGLLSHCFLYLKSVSSISAEKVLWRFLVFLLVFI